jgi:hypothetical protein
MQDALNQLHLDAGFDDDKVAECMESAVQYVEGYLWQSMRPQTIVASYSADGNNYAELIRANFGEIVSVSYFDGKPNNIDVSSVSVDSMLPVARAYFNEPKTAGDYFAPIKIEYKTTAPDTIPAQIKQAILIATACFYDDRNNPDLSGVNRILDIFKTRHLL